MKTRAASSRGVLLTAFLAAASGLAAEAPSEFGVDAPQLAHLGDYAVGTRTLQLIDKAQVDLLTFDLLEPGNTAPRRDRVLTVDLWYPAVPAAGSARAVYTATFPRVPPAPPASFSVAGIAVRNAPAARAAFPLVVVSHGYSSSPAAMTWLNENLASKGYVIAAIRHDDPPITDRSKFPQLLLRRPLDIVFVARALRQSLAALHLIDPSRLALIGFSMGGYGVLTAAGASLDPDGPPTHLVPANLLQPYVRGGPQQSAARIEGLRAVVAISPVGGGKLAAWGPAGILGIEAPLLLIAGDSDRTVDYSSGARTMFETALNAPRYLLTFKGGGHSIGLNPAPDAMRSSLWDQDWFEDPVWRKERLNSIEAHFITAFLGRYVKDDAALGSYLDVPVAQSSDGLWPPSASTASAYDEYSSTAPGVTLWKGFQRNHAEGLELLRAMPTER